MDKKYNHFTHEQAALKLWSKTQPYAFDATAKKPIFSIDTPPPTVSGALHIGHIFSYTHTDIIARYKRMRGFNVFYPMGFDDNGLATERFVEKMHGVKGHKLGRSEFTTMCLGASHNAENKFSDLWKALGLSIDWNHTYSTISPESQKISQLSFIELYEKKLIYRKEEPALYCTTCRTSVAQAELEHIDASSTFNDITFTAHDGSPLSIATTRPELLPACVAVFFHPNDNRYKHLASSTAITPIFNRHVPVIADEQVDPDKGTGLVMCCTFGDSTDIEWYKKHSLPFVELVGSDGLWTDEGDMLAGLRAQEARKKVLELLKKEEKLSGQKPITHTVNVHERCKQEIEYRILKQWFTNVIDHKDVLLKQADKINWKPEFMKARYRNWVENLAWDWCISRQRFYGIPFPVWHCNGCSAILLAPKDALPLDPQETPYPDTTCPKCSSNEIVPEQDVMDTWATSSLSPHINCGWPTMTSPPTIPMSMRPQAHDIIRTWAFYTIAKTLFHNNTIPWNDIVISGHVTTGKEKISKSKGNNKLSPERLLKEHSADVIRYWSAQGRLGVDTALSENQFKIGSRLLTKLWNAFRFIGEHTKAFIPTNHEIRDDVNRWLMHAMSTMHISYCAHFDKYEYGNALAGAEAFFWNTFCDNYLELIKDRLFNPEKYESTITDETHFVLYEVGFGILQHFAPFVPYITETLYQHLYKKVEGTQSLHTTTHNEKRYTHNYEDSTEILKAIVSIVTQVRKLKSKYQLSLKTPLTKLTICRAEQSLQNALTRHEELLRGITWCEKVQYNTAPASSTLRKDGDLYNVTITL